MHIKETNLERNYPKISGLAYQLDEPIKPTNDLHLRIRNDQETLELQNDAIHKESLFQIRIV
jgi:hypothetical protein